ASLSGSFVGDAVAGRGAGARALRPPAASCSAAEATWAATRSTVCQNCSSYAWLFAMVGFPLVSAGVVELAPAPLGRDFVGWSGAAAATGTNVTKLAAS